MASDAKDSLTPSLWAKSRLSLSVSHLEGGVGLIVFKRAVVTIQMAKPHLSLLYDHCSEISLHRGPEKAHKYKGEDQQFFYLLNHDPPPLPHKGEI